MRIGQNYNCLNCETEYVAAGSRQKCCTPECQFEWNVKSAPEHQVCNKCKQLKPIGDYSFRKSTGNHMRVCKGCFNNRAVLLRGHVPLTREQMAKHNPDKNLNWSLGTLYGITLKDFRKMESDQGNKCLICKSGPDLSNRCKRLFVDHCHTTGEVRGLLCQKCNTGLGAFRDNPKLLMKAVFYLGAECDIYEYLVEIEAGIQHTLEGEIARGK